MTIIGDYAVWPAGLPWSATTLLLAAVAGLTLVVLVAALASIVPPAPLAGIPSPPGDFLTGHVYKRTANPPKQFLKWSQELKSGVFQIRLGRKRVLVINTVREAHELLAKLGDSFSSRPTLFTFHQQVVKGQFVKLTLASAPWGEVTQRKRKAGLPPLNNSLVESYVPLLTVMGRELIQGLLSDYQASNERVGDGQNWAVLDSADTIRRFTRMAAIGVNFGMTPKEVDDSWRELAATWTNGYQDPTKEQIEAVTPELLHEMSTYIGRGSDVRSQHGMPQDWLPPLRIFGRPEDGDVCEAVLKLRTIYMNRLLKALKQRQADGKDVPSVLGNIVLQERVKLNHDEMISLCNSMAATGLDQHFHSAMQWAIGFLAANPQAQSKAYDDLLQQHKGERFPDFSQAKSDYLMATVKESLRLSTPLRLSMPRLTNEDVVWRGNIIPKGTIISLNAHAVNRDPSRFKDPERFDPERYMSDDATSRKTWLVDNYSYGIGKRICPATTLANREIYIALAQLIYFFEVADASGADDGTTTTTKTTTFDPDEDSDNPIHFATVPKRFKIACRVRDAQHVADWLSKVHDVQVGVAA